MARIPGALGAALLVAASVVTPGPAAACACGGIVSPDPAARVAEEVALLSTDGHIETVVLRVDLESGSDNAALVIPTPAPATVASADAGIFDELATLAAPRVETQRHWVFGDMPAMRDDAVSGVPVGGPTVLRQVQLGPLQATTLAGGDVDGVRNWLQSNGYPVKRALIDGLQPYLRDGWSTVAMRLTSPVPLNGGLDPVKLTFASPRLVYPMRMAAHADGPEKVVIYTLGPHRMQRVDPDSRAQQVSVDYAGTVGGRTVDTTLTGLSANGGYLTALSTVAEPANVSSDFEFGPAPSDEPYQQLIYRHEYSDITPWIFGGGLAAVAAIALVVAGLRRWLSSSNPGN
ncbi:MAG TPA: DUF2330 domain-containing protein [Mycobacterium sp.]|nr:DUF2330 domain-containing protein [Mycobacterium sp.]